MTRELLIAGARIVSRRYSDRSQNDDLTKSIRLLNSLAIKLREGRMKAGALNLASPEVKIHMDSAESSDPIDVEQKEMRETNSLVEEFMLLANISVARKIQETFPLTSVLRYATPKGLDHIYQLIVRIDVTFRPHPRTSRSYKTS